MLSESEPEIHFFFLRLPSKILVLFNLLFACTYKITQTSASTLQTPSGRGRPDSAFEAAGQDVKLLLYASIDCPLTALSASRLSFSTIETKGRK